MIVIGIDPGLSGAVSLLAPGNTPIVTDTPVAATKGHQRDYMVAEMRALLLPAHGVAAVACIERGIAMPRQSSRTTYVTGRGGGLWEGLLAALEIPYELVDAARWKRALGLTGRDKGASRVMAQQLFPSIAGEFARVKDDGRAEALLIAEWRRRQG